ncbi:MAG: hypothetical protein J6Z18_02330 [Prevotella sp.]|nr:hypothetical protein [Prevotella sp.]
MRIIFLIISIVCCGILHAQDVDTLTVRAREAGRHIIVITDIESRRPLQHASVKVKGEKQLEVGWTGRFEVKKEDFDSLVVLCPNYLTRHLSREEVMNTDTITLIPTGMMLSEVVVLGKANRMHGLEQAHLKEIFQMYTPSDGVATFDFANLIDRRRRHDKKMLKRAEKILENY